MFILRRRESDNDDQSAGTGGEPKCKTENDNECDERNVEQSVNYQAYGEN